MRNLQSIQDDLAREAGYSESPAVGTEEASTPSAPPSFDRPEPVLQIRALEGTGNQNSIISRRSRISYPDAHSSDMLALSSTFCYNVYWIRRWVVQEVALARDILLVQGKTKLPWGVICDIWSTLGTLQHFESDLSPECDRYLKAVRMAIYSTLPFVAQQLIVSTGTEKRLLEQNIAMFRGQMCTDERDVVWSLLGISSPFTTAKIIPDYTKPLATGYIDATRAMILESKSLRALYHREQPSPHRPDSQPLAASKPSWVPDWRNGAMAAGLRILESATNAHYRAAGNTTLSLDAFRPGCSWILMTKGYLYDEISRISIEDPDPLSSWQEAFQHWDHLVQEWIPGIFDSPRDPHSSTDTDSPTEPLVDTYWRTLLQDVVSRKASYAQIIDQPKRIDARDPEVLSNYRDLFLVWRSQDDSAGEHGEPESKPAFIKDFGFSVWLSRNQLLCKTKRGHLALVPMQARVGDRIYVADGSEAPLVVRRRAQGEGLRIHEEKCRCGRWEGGIGEESATQGAGGMYDFLGPAYVHGTMDGEVAETHSRERMEEKETVFFI